MAKKVFCLLEEKVMGISKSIEVTLLRKQIAMTMRKAEAASKMKRGGPAL